MSERKKIIIAVIITFLLTALVTFWGASLLMGFDLSKSSIVESIIKSEYIKEVDSEKIDEYMAKGAAAALGDDYSYYLTSEEYNALMSEITGEYKGIGVEVYLSAEGNLTVSNVFMNTPAEKSGLRPGDIIAQVDDIKVTSETAADAISYMRGLSEEGKKAETMTVVVMRGESSFNADITRAEIIAQTIFAKDIDGIRYMRISSFSPPTYKEFVTSLKDIENCKGLILDVRDNPGGILETVVDMCDALLPKANIVSTKTRSGKEKFYKSDKNFIDIPIAVLINGGSASASEILAGAIKDNNAGVLIGEKSFGKGSVQEIFPFRDKSALKLTIAYYYTPSGVCINDIGIEPDYEVLLPDDNATGPVSTLSPENDPQLMKAIELISSGKITR